jgi:hypothetical protein
VLLNLLRRLLLLLMFNIFDSFRKKTLNTRRLPDHLLCVRPCFTESVTQRHRIKALRSIMVHEPARRINEEPSAMS